MLNPQDQVQFNVHRFTVAPWVAEKDGEEVINHAVLLHIPFMMRDVFLGNFTKGRHLDTNRLPKEF